MRIHSTGLTFAILLLAASTVAAQAPPPAPVTPGATVYTVFLQSRAIGREEVAVVREGDGWILRGSSRLGPPLDLTTERAEVRYDRQWRPTGLVLEATVRGRTVSLHTTFADGKATSAIDIDGAASTKVDDVAADVVVLPNQYLGSYAALARRLVGAAVGDTVQGYVPPQGSIPIRVDGVFSERIDTPDETIAATRFALVISNPAPVGDLNVSLWADDTGELLRLSVPAQRLDLAREDIASAASRTASFSLPGDETVRIPARGFNLAASVTRPANATGPLPALILIGGSGPLDRDGYVSGIPILGQMAGAFVEAGFFVVRYDKRGVGQSGGRTEAATIQDYAEDVRAILEWLEDEQEDVVDADRIGLVGHSEGAWVAMEVAERDDRVAAIALVAGGSSTGAAMVLEQQQHALGLMKAPADERDTKMDLQRRINAAVLGEGSWDGIPAGLRQRSDTPWFRSFLAFDPKVVMEDVDQPVLIVQGELDTQVPPRHAEALAAMSRARDRDVSTDIAMVPKVNHLLVPAATGEVDEYGTLADREVANAVTSAISVWMARELGEGEK